MKKKVKKVKVKKVKVEPIVNLGVKEVDKVNLGSNVANVTE